MGDLKHELSWSSSRAGTFERCARRYYYDYYASWLGWGREAPDERRVPYLLKKMTRLPMLAGDVLHIELANWFEARRAGRPMPDPQVAERAVQRLREGYRESRDGTWRERPAKRTRLAEHHYEEACIDEASGAAAKYGKTYVERIEAGARTVFEAPELADVRSADPESYLALEEMGTIDLFGTRAFAIPDFAYRDGDLVHVYDWKTGSPRPQDRFQLGVYVLYARERFDVEPTNVRCVDAYLTRGEFIELRFDASEVAALEDKIRTSVEAMRELHFDADESLGDPANFPLIDASSADARECASCNYRELCGRS